MDSGTGKADREAGARASSKAGETPALPCGLPSIMEVTCRCDVVPMREGSRAIDTANPPSAVPELLVRLESWPASFSSNLAAIIQPSPELDTYTEPGQFWPDVFVKSHLPWGRFLESAIFHTAVVTVIWSLATIWPRPSQVVMTAALQKPEVLYYEAPEYLPPLNTGQSKTQVSQKGDPEYAPQEVISVPPEADNRKQTIVTPPNLKVDHDVPLPNMVAWNKTAPSVPLNATRDTLRHLPSSQVQVVAPAPDVAHRQLQTALVLNQDVVAPAHEVKDAAARREIPQGETAIVAPPPAVQATDIRRIGDISVAPSQVVAPAPALPMQAQMARSGGAGGIQGSQTVVPPPPSAAATGADTNAGGRMIALNLHPVQPTGPVDVPSGNRRGIFAATPQGKPGASGTPELRGDPNAPAGTAGNSGSGKSVGSGFNTAGIPPGLTVGAVPKATAEIAGNGKGKSAENPRLLADATPSRVSSLPHRTPDTLTNAPSELERKVFGDRRLYSMTLNTPNLNSAGGSWVMHFAELHENPLDKSELQAPVATHEVDPGYPLELMRQNVQGTVTLSAVIQTDGSVGEVKVLNGVDDRLDQYASAALARWKFTPAMRNGNPTPLQAVVMIPFRPMRRSGF